MKSTTITTKAPRQARKRNALTIKPKHSNPSQSSQSSKSDSSSLSLESLLLFDPSRGSIPKGMIYLDCKLVEMLYVPAAWTPEVAPDPVGPETGGLDFFLGSTHFFFDEVFAAWEFDPFSARRPRFTITFQFSWVNL